MHADADDSSDELSYLTVATSAHAFDHAEQDVPSDAGHPDADIVDSEEPSFNPAETSSSAGPLELADPPLRDAHPIDALPQSIQAQSGTVRNVQVFEELPFGTSAAPDDQPTARMVPSSSPDAPFTSGSHDARLADLRGDDHADYLPGEPHRRTSDVYEDVPPAGLGSGPSAQQTSTTPVIQEVEPIWHDLAQSPSRRTPASDQDVPRQVATHVLESARPTIEPGDGGGGPGAASVGTRKVGGTFAGDGDGDGGDVDAGGQRGPNAAVDRRPAEDRGFSEQVIGYVEELDGGGERTGRLGLSAGGMGIDRAEE